MLSSLGSRKEERVWLRDLQAPEAEPGPAPENNLLGAAWAGQEGWAPGRRPPCLEMEMWAELQPYPGPQTCLQEGNWSVHCSPEEQLLGGGEGTRVGSRAKWAPAAPGGELHRLPTCSSAPVYRDLGGKKGRARPWAGPLLGCPGGVQRMVECLFGPQFSWRLMRGQLRPSLWTQG